MVGLKKYLLAIIIAGLAIIVVYQNKEIKQCRLEGLEGGDIAKGELQDSLFVLQTTVGRYEMTLEMLKEEDSTAAAKFEKILYTETE